MLGIAHIRITLALPKSTLSTALRRLEERGYVRRLPNVVDARYVDVVLTRSGESVAPAVTDLIEELEMDVHEAAGGQARVGFDRVATMLVVMDR